MREGGRKSREKKEGKVDQRWGEEKENREKKEEESEGGMEEIKRER